MPLNAYLEQLFLPEAMLKHPDDKVRLLHHHIQILRGAGLGVVHRETEGVRLYLRVPNHRQY